ncbi:replication-relaxation family protein [Conexibacter woesei]|uniref:Protein involved in plasmid replication-relaxation n=1 Tax=Conexibacter woesei (strain DSM 14684 / CCUG 47730 / CIP 108061 / JCM 11494 / NBRC 100937 / ID131577) TaxID=469383 RepID=D3FEB7_CONWI|nr:replication-relaxation family protein [Conexibacter woesei]ADB53609.1 hypothetical protein Cwoe_5203 [Conexibacter woesei DSM 14684]
MLRKTGHTPPESPANTRSRRSGSNPDKGDQRQDTSRPTRVTTKHLLTLASRLTDRDRQIVIDCYEHTTLTTDQLTRLHFRHPNTARERLDVLYRLRMLDRFRPEVRLGEGSAPYHWILDEAGAHVVADELGLDREQLRWRHATAARVAVSSKLDHHVATNEFFVRLAVELRAAGGSLHEWYGEKTTSRLLGGIVTPDGYGVLHLPDRAPLHLLLEVDRGTEPLRRIREKIDRYSKALPRSELASVAPLVVFVAPTDRRAHSIRTTAADKNAVWVKIAVWTQSGLRRLMPLLVGPADADPIPGSQRP